MNMTLDRVEGETAVLIAREDESVRIDVPVSLLPPGSREGDILTIRIVRNTMATDAVRKEVLNLVEKLKKQ
jgi:hypothetical protein